MTKIVVTGAGGLTGAEITKGLVERGHSVVAVVRRRTDTPGAIVVVGDCADPAIIGLHLSGADVLVHVAGILEGGRVARLPEFGRVPRVIAVSSAGVYSRHRTSAAAYLAGEHALAGANPGTMVVRPTMIYGSARDRNIHHLVRFAARYRFLPQIGDGVARLQPIYFADLAAAIVALVDQTGTESLDAGGGRAITLAELLRSVLAALGRPPRIVRLPAGPFRLAASVTDIVRGGRWAERIDRLAEDRIVEVSRLVRVTGIHPRAFEEGVRDQVDAMRRDGTLA